MKILLVALVWFNGDPAPHRYEHPAATYATCVASIPIAEHDLAELLGPTVDRIA